MKTVETQRIGPLSGFGTDRLQARATNISEMGERNGKAPEERPSVIAKNLNTHVYVYEISVPFLFLQKLKNCSKILVPPSRAGVLSAV